MCASVCARAPARKHHKGFVRVQVKMAYMQAFARALRIAVINFPPPTSLCRVHVSRRRNSLFLYLFFLLLFIIVSMCYYSIATWRFTQSDSYNFSDVG